MVKKKITLETLVAEMRYGFGSLGDEIQKIDDRMQTGFAVAGDIAYIKRDMATKHELRNVEKRLGNRIDGLKVQVEGEQNTFDAEAMKRSDLQLPPMHFPL
jgi:hypothetical protein